jgi:hypothetical protein
MSVGAFAATSIRLPGLCSALQPRQPRREFAIIALIRRETALAQQRYEGATVMQNMFVTSALAAILILSGCYEGATPDEATTGPRSDRNQQADDDAGMPALNSESGTATVETPAEPAGRVNLDGITLAPPGNWEQKPPASQIIAAEYSLPRAEGDDADGRLTISTAGGSVEANIDRWKGQFVPQPQEASQEEIDVARLKITVVDYSGDFNDQRGPFAPADKRPGYRMIGAVIPVQGQLYFIKATGPQKTIAKHADAIHEFIRSARAR